MLKFSEQLFVIAGLLHAMRGVPDCHHKVRVCDVGNDRYGSGDHPELTAQCYAWCIAQGLKNAPPWGV